MRPRAKIGVLTTTGMLLVTISRSAQPDRASPTGPKQATTVVTADPLAEATALYRKGRFTEAEQTYQQVLLARPKSGDAYAGLTRVYLKTKKVKEADAAISKGLEVADSPQVRVALGEVYFRQGKISEAEREWLNVLNSGRADARCHLGLARVSTAATLYKQAKSEIDKAHALDPNDPDVQTYWIRTLKPSEQVTYLEDYLSRENGASAEEQAHLRNYLEYLKNRLKDTVHSCRLAAKLTSAEADLFRISGERASDMRGYGLAAALNGQTAKLQLDTGASGIVIDRKIAQKAGLTKLSDTTLGGFGNKGKSSGYFAMADTIKIGKLEFQDCPVVVVDKRSVLGEDGIIGADVFQEFLIDIDFQNEKLRLGPLPKRPDENPRRPSLQTVAGQSDSSETGSTDAVVADPATPPGYTSLSQRFFPPEFSFSFTPVFRFGHMLLISTEVGDIPARLFAIDTGAPRNVFSVSVAREITRVQGNPRMTVKGLSGSVNKVYTAEKTALAFGHVQQYAENQITLDLEPLSDNLGTEVSGVLGVFSFSSLDVTIDYRDALVAFEFKPKT